MQNIISDQQLLEKVTLLDQMQKQTVYEFIEFLLSRQPNQPKSKKKQLLKTSIWSEKEIAVIEEARRDLNTWKLPTL